MNMNKNTNPKHIAIILDGNRRYAIKSGLKPWEGHKSGFKKIEDILDWSKELDIKELTLYCFSTENFNRDKMEVKYLFDLFRNRINDLMNDARIHENKVRIRIIGRIDLFPKDMQEKMQEIMEKTSGYDKFKLNLCMAYGGRQEIVDAVRKIVASNIKPESIDEELLSKNMYLESCPDLLIRPGGEKRLSNFLTWESIYSELFFLDKLWPEMTKEDLADIIKEFKKRERRFGS